MDQERGLRSGEKLVSRTDKTKPWRVRVAEHHPVAEHDHCDGICDLPDNPLDPKWHGCHWSDHNLTNGDCCRKCGCSQCSDTAGRKARRKKERQEARQANAREIAWGDERFGGTTRRKTTRKDTSVWCKGKVGRPHVKEVRWANWADCLRIMGRKCFEEAPGHGWRSGWHCYHEVGCSACGKILESCSPRELCPVWLEQQ